MTSNTRFNRRSLLNGGEAVILALVAVIFVRAQRYFIEGMIFTGLLG
jgi:hypothetical protein